MAEDYVFMKNRTKEWSLLQLRAHNQSDSSKRPFSSYPIMLMEFFPFSSLDAKLLPPMARCKQWF